MEWIVKDFLATPAWRVAASAKAGITQMNTDSNASNIMLTSELVFIRAYPCYLWQGVFATPACA